MPILVLTSSPRISVYTVTQPFANCSFPSLSRVQEYCHQRKVMRTALNDEDWKGRESLIVHLALPRP